MVKAYALNVNEKKGSREINSNLSLYILVKNISFGFIRSQTIKANSFVSKLSIEV